MCLFFGFGFRSFFGVFYGVRAGLRNLFFLQCFSCPFLALGAGRRAALFSVRFFGCVFVCVFSSLWFFFGPFLVLGAGRRAALFSVRFFWVCFCLCFLFSLGFFWFLFGPGMLGAALLFFSDGLVGCFFFLFFLPFL